MKIKTDVYANLLISSADEEGQIKEIAKKFWYFLQKNNQHRQLKQILESVDEQQALLTKKRLVKIFSDKELPEEDKKILQEKLEKKFNQSVIIKNIIKPGLIAGVVIKSDDQIVDLSINGGINSLGKRLQL